MSSLISLLVACTPGASPLVEAHRGGAGYWPENSRTSMLGAIDAGFDGIELDLVLTRDDVPVIAHDPWLADHCTWADGTPLTETVRYDQLRFAELTRDYVCGGIPDPDFRDALVVAEPVMAFDELLGALRLQADPGQLIHLDIKQEPGLTASPDRFAEAILGRWADADLPNPWVMSSNLPEVTAAFEAQGRVLGIDVTSLLGLPRFPPESSELGVALAHQGGLLTGAYDYINVANEAGVDGLSIQWELADRHNLVAAERAGLILMLWTLNDPKALRHHARWPVDALISDFPGDL